MKITQNHIVEFLALLVSLLFWKFIKKGKLRSLPFFLFFILCVELLGTYFRTTPYANAKLYNFSIPIEYFFYIFLFWLHGGAILKRFEKFTAFVLASVVVFYFITKPFFVFHSKVLLTGQAIVVVSFCIYLYEQFKSDLEEPLLNKYFFWLGAGLFLFNLGEFTYFLLYPVINSNDWDKTDALFKAINHNLLLLLYLSYIIAIIIQSKHRDNNA